MYLLAGVIARYPEGYMSQPDATKCGTLTAALRQPRIGSGGEAQCGTAAILIVLQRKGAKFP